MYSCSQLKSAGDLSPLKVGRANFSNAKKIQEIKLGDGAEGYSNGNLTELTLGNNTMLRRLDLRNCPNLVAPLDVSQCLNMEELYLDGTAITGLMLPNGGVLKKLHVPVSLANLTIRNQTKITEFSMPDYGGITTLRLENVAPAVPVFDILEDIQDGARVRIIGFQLEFADTDAVSVFYDSLERFRGLDENGGNVDTAQMSGTIHMDTARKDVIANLKGRYPYIEIRPDHYQTSVYYYTYDGETLLGEEVITDGGNGTWVNTLSRDSTAQYDFTPNGWTTTMNGAPDANALSGVTENRKVYAAYNAVVRTYDVIFIRHPGDGGGTLYTQEKVPYGTVSVYRGATPTTERGEAAAGYGFLRWDPALAKVNGTNLTYTAVFDWPPDKRILPDTWEEVIASLSDGSYRTKYKPGNTFSLDLGAGGVVNAMLVCIDGFPNAKMTFVTEKTLAYPVRFATSWCQKYSQSYIASYLNTTVYNMFPDVLKAVMTETNRVYSFEEGGVSGKGKDWHAWKVWLPDNQLLYEHDYGYTAKYYSMDALYPQGKNKRYRAGTTTYVDWWSTGYMSGGNRTYHYTSSGYISYGDADSPSGYYPIFCFTIA